MASVEESGRWTIPRSSAPVAWRPRDHLNISEGETHAYVWLESGTSAIRANELLKVTVAAEEAGFESIDASYGGEVLPQLQKQWGFTEAGSNWLMLKTER